ncbi:MAG: bifunctional adenosylcobinamide kinase/adenosylcobinamide-phosphate guanylyltransferase [Myxococcota bacterium]
MALVMIGGGARSGKSRYAEVRALQLPGDKAYVATAQAFDDEMRERIAAHRQARDPSFQLYEEPREVPSLLKRLAEPVVVVDCLTLWLSNLLLADLSDSAIEVAFDALEDALARPTGTTLLVTNEVGLGIVPTSALGRRFRDHAGRLHQRLADRADEVILAALGLRLRLKPGPVEAV